MKARARLKTSASYGVRPAVERIRMPHRAAMASRFGAQVAHLPVYTGPKVEAALRKRQADAAAFDGAVLLRDASPSADLIAHEIVHALQQPLASGDPEALLARLERAPAVPAESRAETEAQVLADPQGPGDAVTIRHALAPGMVALRRTGSDVPVVEAPQPAPQQSAAPAAASAPVAQSAAPLETAAPETAVSDPAPTFTPAEVPETALDPEADAARAAERAAAEEALAAAATPSAVMEAYAAMPPSAKALHTATIDRKIAEANGLDTASLAERTPVVEAALSGEDSALPAPAPIVMPGDPGAAVLAAPPAPEIDVPAAPEQPAVLAPTGVFEAVSRDFAGGADPQAIEDRVQSVATNNPGIATRVAERADIPLGGANDPARMDEVAASRAQEAAAARGAAAQAVVDGPGPEAVMPRAMAHGAPEPDLTPRETAALQPVEGIAQLNALALPGEVVARFDEQTGASMAQSAAAAAQQIGAAEADRDTAHADAVATAQASCAETERSADEQQRDAIVERRDAIQTERQNTVDAQQAAVDNVHAEAAREREASRSEAEARIAADRAAIDATYDQAERDSDAEVRAGEQRAESRKAEAEREAENDSWWDRATSFIARAFEALTSAIGAIFDAVRSAVSAIIDLAVRAVTALIELAAAALQAIVEAYGALLKGLIDGLLGEIFPELAAALTAFVDAAVATVNAAIDVVAGALIAAVEAAGAALNAAINALLDLYQSAINGVLSVLQAALTGDWGAVLRQVLDGILSILGIDPAAFHAMIAQATDAIDKIVNDPGAFVGNMLEAVVGGIRQFAGNFADHLRGGIIGWLTGALGDIEMPQEWNLWGLLDLARQILGLTWDFVRERAARIIGPENVERLEMAFDWIMTLVNEGWSGVWERIQAELESLKDAVLEGIRNLVLEKVVMAAIGWLASLFNPVGAIVKLVMTIWNIYQFVSAQLQRLFGIAQAVVAGIANIANGVLGPARDRIEAVLANLLPVVIDLLMSLLGVSGVAARVQRIIGNIREAIANAVDRMIDRVVGMFTGGRRGAGGTAGAAGGASLDDVADARVNVGNGPDHTISVEPRGEGGATIIMRSDPLPLRDWLARLDTMADGLEDDVLKSQTKGDIQNVERALATLDDKSDELAVNDGPEATAAQQAANAQNVREISEQLRSQLAIEIGHIFEVLGNVGGAAILDRFAEDLKKVHPEAVRIMRRDLQANATALIQLDWAAVVAWFEQTNDMVKDPFDTSRNFGDKLRGLFTAALIASNVSDVSEQRRVMNHIGLAVRSKDAAYTDISGAISPLIFQNVTPASALFDAVVARALLEMQPVAGAGQAEIALLTALAGSDDIIPFLIDIATKGESTRHGVTITEAELEQMWSNTNPHFAANRELIDRRFRGADSGKHEWIPTDMVQNVFRRARQATLVGQESAELAALWIQVQHEWRSPTNSIIFNPEGRQLRSFQVPIASASGTSNETVIVLQGHTHAIYASADDAGAIPNEKMGQWKGQQEWHDVLRSKFGSGSVGSNSKLLLEGILNDVAEFVDTSVWKGLYNSEIEDFFTYMHQQGSGAYYKDRASGAMTLGDLATRGTSGYAQIRADFTRARGVLKP